MQEHFAGVLDEKLTVLYGCVDTFERHVDEHLWLTQTLDISTIWMEIQQFYDWYKYSDSSTINDSFERCYYRGANLFAGDPPASASRKRPCTSEDDPDTSRREAGEWADGGF